MSLDVLVAVGPLAAAQDPRDAGGQQRVGERGADVGGAVQRSLGAEDPDLESGLPRGREPDRHHIGAAPRLLGQREQLRQRPSERRPGRARRRSRGRARGRSRRSDHRARRRRARGAAAAGRARRRAAGRWRWANTRAAASASRPAIPSPFCGNSATLGADQRSQLAARRRVGRGRRGRARARRLRPSARPGRSARPAARRSRRHRARGSSARRTSPRRGARAMISTAGRAPFSCSRPALPYSPLAHAARGPSNR